MTIEEIKKRIDKECYKYYSCSDGCKLFKNFGYCPIEKINNDETIKEMYNIIFGKEESEMKNEFDFNELKAGYAIKIPAYGDELFVGIPVSDDEDDIIFYSKELKGIIRKKQIVTKKIYKEHSLDEKYIPVEVYGLSSNIRNLFDPSTRPLLWKKEEDMNTKNYNIGKLSIEPNYDGYKTEKEDEGIYNGFIYIGVGKDEYGDESITIHKSELDDVINALTEIRDFVKED